MEAVCLILGTNLPTEGPGLSALIRCILLPPASGVTARTNTRTPIPPIQWVKLRQNRIPRGKCSTAGRMVAPVVVKPETVSKNASMGLVIAPLKMKGSAPKIASKIQAAPTHMNPSLA